MRIQSIVKYDVINLLKNPLFYFLILLSMFPSFAISFSIKELKGPFDLQHITSFFSLFASISLFILVIGVFTKDISNGTVSFFMNNKSSRVSYITAKIISILVYSFIFGLIGVLTIHLCHVTYIGNATPYITYLDLIINYTIFGLFFGTLFLLISLFYRNIVLYYILGILFITFLPGIITTLLFWERTPDYIVTIVDHIPLYTLPAFLGGNAFELSHYVAIIVSILIIVGLTFIFVKKRDY